MGQYRGPSAALGPDFGERLTLDEQVVVETRGRLDASEDREWSGGKRVMRFWDVQRVRRAFGRSSDEFCEELHYDKAIEDEAARFGIAVYFEIAALESLQADMLVNGRLSASAQMTLFNLDSMIRTETRYRQTGKLQPRHVGLVGLLRWLHTQGVPWREAVGASLAEELPEPAGMVMGHPILHERRDPDPVCIEALSAFGARDVSGWFSKPINSARTPSVLPRAVTWAAWSDVPERVFEQAVANALLTHGHPDAYLSAGAYSVLVNTLLAGGTLSDGIEVAVDELATWPDENVRRLLRSCELDGPTPSRSELSALIEDGSAPNVLAVAAVVAARDDEFESSVRRAAEIAPEAAPLVGAFHGARNGSPKMPRAALNLLEARQVAIRLARGVAEVQTGWPDRGWTPEWAELYPAL
ncbi:ADP-ribosylglycohydrolase family protein [Saccharopolyspora flava]|uniref:ADP-ribosylglycohydrolase n=1 Tax=Saccharopolyspora flava TaxID=95161 RepID=A0A1I6PWF6_9PSEU|nr:ADP-ribosylglycohydrolase family protein [Saccharopolyspora flava]SFS44410.1 ADP-ribosylglycohydrolase [Saccharopolyspora flava]